jgi:hypothetical protein
MALSELLCIDQRDLLTAGYGQFHFYEVVLSP